MSHPEAAAVLQSVNEQLDRLDGVQCLRSTHCISKMMLIDEKLSKEQWGFTTPSTPPSTSATATSSSSDMRRLNWPVTKPRSRRCAAPSPQPLTRCCASPAAAPRSSTSTRSTSPSASSFSTGCFVGLRFCPHNILYVRLLPLPLHCSSPRRALRCRRLRPPLPHASASVVHVPSLPPRFPRGMPSSPEYTKAFGRKPNTLAGNLDPAVPEIDAPSKRKTCARSKHSVPPIARQSRRGISARLAALTSSNSSLTMPATLDRH